MNSQREGSLPCRDTRVLTAPVSAFRKLRGCPGHVGDFSLFLLVPSPKGASDRAVVFFTWSCCLLSNVWEPDFSQTVHKESFDIIIFASLSYYHICHRCIIILSVDVKLPMLKILPVLPCALVS